MTVAELEKAFQKVWTLFKETDKKIFAAVAGIVIEQGADRYAYKKGLFVLGQSGETVKILNDEQFEPKTW